jgi:PKD repeat protein
MRGGSSGGGMKRSGVVLAGLAALVVLAVSAPAANAVVVQLSNGHFAGVYLRAGVSAAAFERRTGARPMTRASLTGVAPDGGNGLVYNGGPVLHTTKPYLVFWDPNSDISMASRDVMINYYTDAAADGSHPADVYAYRVLSQYTDSGGSAAQGQTFSSGTQVINAAQAYPTNNTNTCPKPSGITACITDSDIDSELTTLINAQSLPTGIGANAPIYFVVTPANVNVCTPNGGGCSTDAFCAYHSAYIGPGSSTVIYASIPFTLGASCQDAGPVNPPTQEPNGDVADVVTDNMSHENAESITDPIFNAWLTTNGEEVADQCEAEGPYDPNDPFGSPTNPDAYIPILGGSQADGTLYDQLLGTDHYFTQTLWSNSSDNCEATATVSPSFTPAAPIQAGVSASFDPSASVSTDGYASTTWNWGDGSANTVLAGAPAVTGHTYASPGTYTVTLTLVDARGDTAQVSHNVTVYTALTAAFSPSTTVAETGSPVTFSSTGSSDPNAGQSITGYSWSFGDGSAAGAGATPNHTYSSPGTYTVTLTVTGSEGLTSTVSHSITVVAAPVAVPAVGTAHPVNGSPVSFTGTASTGGISTYAWNFGDGATGAGASPSHTYARAGTYTVTLTVTDASGFTSTGSLTVVVAKSPIRSVSTKHASGAYYVVVTVTQAGTVKFGSTKVTLKRPGKATFKIPLSAAQTRKLRQGKKVSLSLTITFTPKHGPQVRRPTTVTL